MRLELSPEGGEAVVEERLAARRRARPRAAASLCQMVPRIYDSRRARTGLDCRGRHFVVVKFYVST